MSVEFLGVKPVAGEVVYGSLELDNVHIPIVLACGTAEGPALVLHCAQHRTEYSGSAMIGQLLAQIDLAKLRGLVVILPLADVAMVVRTRLSETYLKQAAANKPAEGTERSNINRVWPGVKDGTWNERLAWMLSHEVFAKCDAVLDYHSCRICDACFTSYVESSSAGRDIALAFGFEIVDQMGDQGHFPGQLHRRVPIELGIPAILVEMSPTSTQVSWQAMQQARIGALNVMKHMGMMDGPLELPPRQLIFHRGARQVVFAAGQIGFAVTYRRPGDFVRDGDLIAEVRSFKDFSVLESHKAPCDGGLASCGPEKSHVVLPGEELATLQPDVEVVDNE